MKTMMHEDDIFIAPHNTEAEQGFLGAVMADNRCMDKAEVLPEHFYHPAHGRIFKACRAIINQGSVANAITLKSYFDKDDELEHVGGQKYLIELQANVVSRSNARDYALEVIKCFQRRELWHVLQDAMDKVYHLDFETPVEKVMGEIETSLLKIHQHNDQSEGNEYLDDCLEAAIERAERVYKGERGGLSSGLGSLDEITRGFSPGQLIIIGARPGMGKTAFGLMASRAAAMAGEAVLFFSMEMPSSEIGGRSLAAATGFSVRDQKSHVTQHDMQRLISAREELRGLNITVDQREALTVGQIRSKARQTKLRHRQLGLIVIDYLGLVKPTDRRMQRVYQIEEITTGMKAMAKELQVPVILLSQLNRSLESREDKRPMLSDLRDSGSIEQDADIVIGLYREEYYLAKSEPSKSLGEDDEKYAQRRSEWLKKLDDCEGRADILVLKNRDGITSTASVYFDGPRSTFYEIGG